MKSRVPMAIVREVLLTTDVSLELPRTFLSGRPFFSMDVNTMSENGHEVPLQPSVTKGGGKERVGQ